MEENIENRENQEEQKKEQEKHKEYHAGPKEPREKKSFSQLYNKYYKILMIIPVIFLVFCLIYLTNFQSQNGDIIRKDITLTGGTSIQVNSQIDIEPLRVELENNFGDVTIREVNDITTGEQVAFIVETTASPEEIKPFLEDYLNIKLTGENSTIEFTGSVLSTSFYSQLKFAIVLSFIFMALVVFFIFRTAIPSMAVVFAALSDIVMTLFVINFLGIKVSTAGIIAFLMLIGYSVDTDILLTARVIRRKEGTIDLRIFNAFKTGIMMTLTSLLAVIIGVIMASSFSKVFSQIFTVLAIGLLFDLVNTWFFNAGIIKWYAHKKEQ